FRSFRSSASLAAATGAARSAGIARAAGAAAATVIGRGHALLDMLSDLETERAAAALAALVEKELARAPFDVHALELEAEIEIRGKRLRVRIDRIDALASGGLVVIDYKTGGTARTPDWLGDRPHDPQLPLYAAAVPRERLAGLVIAAVRPTRADYLGLWTPLDAFPGRSIARNGEMTPQEIADAAHDRLAALVDEYVAGDVRLFIDERDA